MCVSRNDYEGAKNKMTDVLRNNTDNIIAINNIGIFNFYLNKIDKSYEDYQKILSNYYKFTAKVNLIAQMKQVYLT